MRGWRQWWTACAVALLLAGCASTGKQTSALQSEQYIWSAAIRWGDFEGAWNMLEPDYREAHPMSDLQFERYKQIQISHYRDLASRPGETEAAREIEIGVINKHTMAERTMRYTERWRYDAATEKWWVTSGLPDFWAGE